MVFIPKIEAGYSTLKKGIKRAIRLFSFYSNICQIWRDSRNITFTSRIVIANYFTNIKPYDSLNFFLPHFSNPLCCSISSAAMLEGAGKFPVCASKEAQRMKTPWSTCTLD